MFKLRSPDHYQLKINEASDNRDKIASEAALKIRNSKIAIHKSISFFSKILLSLQIIEDWSIKTMCTDGAAVYYNPKFTVSLTDGECTFVIMHELLHVVFLHFSRMEGRDHKKWNYATDYAINLLLDNKEVTSTLVLKMPKGGLLDQKYRNMSAEQIYDTNPTNPNKDKKTSTQEAPKLGDYIKSKDGKYGKITAENPDGTFSIEEVSKEEASKYAKV